MIRFNASDEDAASEYLHLARLVGLVDSKAREAEAAEALAQSVEELVQAAGFPLRLSELGVGDHELKSLAEEAARQWTAQFNPREVGAAEFEELYRVAITGS